MIRRAQIETRYEIGERDNDTIDDEKTRERERVLQRAVVYSRDYLVSRALRCRSSLRFISQFRGDNSSAMQESIGDARSGIARYYRLKLYARSVNKMPRNAIHLSSAARWNSFLCPTDL